MRLRRDWNDAETETKTFRGGQEIVGDGKMMVEL